MQLRLDKFLADAGFGTRSEVKNMIKKKSVTLNGEPAVRPETKVNPEMDVVAVNGNSVKLRGSVTYLLHKPAGYVCAVTDNRFPTVMELVPSGRDLFPVGRLDKDTEGLLLITNDGAMAHHMLSPRSHVDKTYLAVLDRPAEQEDVILFLEGVDIGDETRTLPAKLVIINKGASDSGVETDNHLEDAGSTGDTGDSEDTGSLEESGTTEMADFNLQGNHVLDYLPPEQRAKLCPGNLVLLTIQEGRYHQVKRMFHAIGKEVVYLKRLSFGKLVLPLSLRKGDAIVVRPTDECLTS